ncbi:MAG: GNAT family N-acetyltransferase [Chitinophagales bacterium]
MNISIRYGEVGDAINLSAFGIATFTETWEYLYKPEDFRQYLEESYSVEVIKKELEDPALTYFLAYADDELAGFAKLSRKQTLGDWITDHCLEVCKIYALKKFHDQKIGKALMEKTIELAEEEKMESLVLGVWENNHRAVNFYRKFGFEKIGEHPFLIGKQLDIDWVMKKKLKPA